jgi:hypothetical protein
MSKCPHCKNEIQTLEVEKLKTPKTEFGILTLSCPKCRTIISTQIDQIAITNWLLAKIKAPPKSELQKLIDDRTSP